MNNTVVVEWEQNGTHWKKCSGIKEAENYVDEYHAERNPERCELYNTGKQHGGMDPHYQTEKCLCENWIAVLQ